MEGRKGGEVRESAGKFSVTRASKPNNTCVYNITITTSNLLVSSSVHSFTDSHPMQDAVTLRLTIYRELSLREDKQVLC